MANWIDRSFNICNFVCSPSQVFVHGSAFKNQAKFTGKYRCWSLFLESCQPPISNLQLLLRKRHKHRCYPVSFVNFLRISFLLNNSVDYFCKFNVVKVRFLNYFTVLTKLVTFQILSNDNVQAQPLECIPKFFFAWCQRR